MLVLTLLLLLMLMLLLKDSRPLNGHLVSSGWQPIFKLAARTSSSHSCTMSSPAHLLHTTAHNTLCDTSSAHSTMHAHLLHTTAHRHLLHVHIFCTQHRTPFYNVLQLISFAIEGNFGHIETLKLQGYIGRFIINQ